MTTAAAPWVTRTFGLALSDCPSDGAKAITDLVELGLRRNPRRAHLLVSRVLGKHIAAAPDIVTDAGHRLGERIKTVVDGDVDVLAMAETATSLGHCVANRLDAAVYLHTTRRAAPPTVVYAGFQEGHSHATDHTLQPADAGLLGSSRPLVIVDDEISTGTTALAAIRALHRRRPRSRYVVASLVDVREEHHSDAAARTAELLDVRIDHVSLAEGQVMLPHSLIRRVNALPAPRLNTSIAPRRGSRRRLVLSWPKSVPDGGRHGFLRRDRGCFDAALHTVVERLCEHVDAARPVLVVGHEEFMYLPLRAAECLAARGFEAMFQSTTRSPAYVHDAPGYPLRRGFRFSACEPGEDQPRYLYNGWPSDEPGADVQLVLMVDAAADTGRLTERGGAVDVLTAAGYDVLVATVPGPSAARLARERAGGCR